MRSAPSTGCSASQSWHLAQFSHASAATNLDPSVEWGESPRIDGTGQDGAARPGRPAAAAVIWRWREAKFDAVEPTSKIIVRAVIQSSVGFAVAGILFNRVSKPMAYVVLAIACVNLGCAVVSPHGVYRGIERGLAWFGTKVGLLLSWLLLAPLLYVFFFPFGMLFRRGKNDLLGRTYDRSAATYWTTRSPNKLTSRERQF